MSLSVVVVPVSSYWKVSLDGVIQIAEPPAPSIITDHVIVTSTDVELPTLLVISILSTTVPVLFVVLPGVVLQVITACPPAGVFTEPHPEVASMSVILYVLTSGFAVLSYVARVAPTYTKTPLEKVASSAELTTPNVLAAKVWDWFPSVTDSGLTPSAMSSIVIAPVATLVPILMFL
jgi:hypothetical protein